MSDGDLQRYLDLKGQLRRLVQECATHLRANTRGPDFQRAAARRDAVVTEMLSMRDADGWRPLPAERAS